MAWLADEPELPSTVDAADYATRESRFGCRMIAASNQHAELTAVLRDLLIGAGGCHLAVGYLFFEGLAPLLDSLDRLEYIELLIGNVVNRLTEEQMHEMGDLPRAGTGSALSDTEFAARYLSERDRAARETALNLRRTIETMPHTSGSSNAVVALARWIAEGKLHVRVATRSRLHAKVTLVDYSSSHAHAPGRAIVGSSNLTLVEAGQNNVSAGGILPQPSASNLDVLLDGEENYRSLVQWFKHHWDDAQDFRRELFQELGRAWPLSEQ